MKIYFVHKPTGVKISLDKIKDNKYYNFSFTDFNKSEGIYNYRALDILLSEDFKIEIIDDTFTVGELYKIYTYLKSYNFDDSILLDKLYNKFITKRKEEYMIK